MPSKHKKSADSGKRKITASFFPLDDGACSLYRVIQPALKLQQYDLCKVNIIRHSKQEDTIKSIEGSDVIFVARPANPAVFKFIDWVKGATDKKVIVDHDDNIYKISPMSPHYEYHGTEEVHYTYPDGKKVKLWEDGKEKFDIKRNKMNIDCFTASARLSDMVTVTTPQLAEAYEGIGKRVEVLPNCIDFNIWRMFPPKDDGLIRLGWHGGYSHYEDWYQLKNVLPELFSRHNNLRLVLLGTEFKGLVKDIPVEFHPWVEVNTHPMKLASLGIDIAIIPLADTEFNYGKSSIKYHEFSALKVPSVVSNVYPYKLVVEHGKNGFMVNSEAEWIYYIDKLIKSKNLRKEIGKHAYEATRRDYNADTNCHLWHDAMLSLF